MDCILLYQTTKRSGRDKKASTLAVGQNDWNLDSDSGITDEIREKYMGKAVNIFDIPALIWQHRLKRGGEKVYHPDCISGGKFWE